MVTEKEIMKKIINPSQPSPRKGAYKRRGRPSTGVLKKVPSPSMLVYDVPVKLRIAFKLAVTAKGSTISAAVRQLMTDYVAVNPVK